MDSRIVGKVTGVMKINFLASKAYRVQKVG